MLADVVVKVENGIPSIVHVRNQLTVCVIQFDSEDEAEASVTVSKCTKFCSRDDPQYGQWRVEENRRVPVERAREWLKIAKE